MSSSSHKALDHLINTNNINSWLLRILNERFNLDLKLEIHKNYIFLKIDSSDKKVFLPSISESFLTTNPHAQISFSHWDAKMEGWNSILGSPIPAPNALKLSYPLIENKEGNYIINYDILGLIYWMLSRIEEIGRTDLDNHGRFPAIASHAYKFGYLERPIVDEWLHILGQVIQRTWPQAQLKQHCFQIKVSHDVDNPTRYGFCNIQKLIQAILIDSIKYRNFRNVVIAPWIRLNTKTHLHPKDPYNTFEWIMDVSEKYGLTSAFYFICGGNTSRDADYQLEHPAIRTLIRRIYERGHEIGLHPSYNTYQNPKAIITEAQRLKQVCQEENIKQTYWGGRMHYLRWEQPTTIHGWELAGMNYDSTLAYADRPGFRCGTCFEYPAFDPLKQEILNVRIRPLITMECTIISRRYMNLSYSDQSLKKFLSFKETCRKLKGNFTLLWHNSHFTREQDKDYYLEILKY